MVVSMQSVRSIIVGEERKDAQRKASSALLLSLLFHIALILCIAWLYSKKNLRLVLQKEDPVTMNLVSLPSHLEHHPSDATAPPLQQTPFESDRSTRAASSVPAKGNLSLPTLEEKEGPTLQLENRDYTPGKHSGNRASAAQKEALQQQKKLLSSSSKPLPKTQLPILKPLTHEDSPLEETPSPLQKTTSYSRSHPSSAELPGYQPETRVLRIDGNISNRGRAAADVAATPLGSYKRLLSNAVGARWYYLVQRDIDLYRIGTVVIRFKVQTNGHIDTVQILSNTSNELLAATSIQSIKDAEMPPIPSNIANSLEQGRIEVDYTFSIISN